MRSVASTPLRFIGMLVAANAVLFAVVLSAGALVAEKHARKFAIRLDNLLVTSRFSDAADHLQRAGVLGLIFAGIAVAGIVLSLHQPRIAAPLFLADAVAGAIITPFSFALSAFILLNAAVIVFFGRREVPTHMGGRVEADEEVAAPAPGGAQPLTAAPS